MNRLLGSFLLSLFILTGSAYRPGDEVCVIDQDNSCSLESLTISKRDGSTLIYPGGKTRCAFDDFSSFQIKTNATFFFQVFPKKESKKLLVYFQSGGACVDERTCSFAAQCSLPVPSFNVMAIARSTGILDASNPNNMFRDWNIVHIPYCTGDVHIGNTKIPANDSDLPAIQFGCAGKNMTTHLNGYENSMSALTWALTNYPNPEQLMLVGSSAGALGVQLMSEYIANLWNVKERRLKFNVMLDSYVGVVPNSTTCSALINFVGGCQVLPLSLHEKCTLGALSTVEIMQQIVRDTYYGDWLHITSTRDWVQRLFEIMLEFVRDPRSIFNYLDPTKFFEQMNAILDGEKKASTRVSVFFVESDKHVFLLDREWYNERRAVTRENLGKYVSNWFVDESWF